MGLMTLLDKHLTLIACMAALMFTGCADSSGGSSGPDKRVTARLTLASLGDTLRPEIDSAGRPDPPAGFTDNDISALATILVDLASTSFSRGTLEVKEVDDKVERVLGPLKAIYPDTAVEFLEAVSKKYGPIPWQRMLVDPFGPGSQPRRAADILKVTWDAEGGTHSGDRLVLLRLQVHAAYDVGTERAPRMIGIRRTFELHSYGLDYVPGLGAGVETFGANGCVASTTGDLVSTTDARIVAEDRRSLKESLITAGIVEDESTSKADLEKAIKKCRAKANAQDGLFH